MAAEIYSDLNAERQETRIAILQPAPSWTDDIRCDLQVVSLNEKPEYSALSYVWGDAKKTLPIFLNGRVWQVTENLESAFRHCRGFKVIRLWIDAICIDQSNLAEREYQVGIMGQIFAKSLEVLIWFGPDAEGVPTGAQTETRNNFFTNDNDRLGNEEQEQGFAVYSSQASFPVKDEVLFIPADEAQLSLLVFNMIVSLADEKVHLKQLSIFDSRDPTPGQVTSHGRKILRGLKAFVRNSWWLRIWVVQEVVLPAEVRLIWGSCLMNWPSIAKAADNIAKHCNSCCRGLGAYVDHEDWATFLKFQFCVSNIELQRIRLREEGFGLYSLLHTFGTRLATNPRDMIYGLLGLVTNWDVSRTPRITADYTQSISIVYQKATMSTMFDTLLADILVMSGGERSIPELPSWVPDWSTHPVPNHHLDPTWQQNRIALLEAYAAWTGPGIDPFFQESVLVMVGCYVDDIQHVGETMTSGNHNVPQSTTTVWEQWQDMVGLTHLSEGEYVTKKGTIFEAFWRTMFGDLMWKFEGFPSERSVSVSNCRRAVSEDECAWKSLLKWMNELTSQESGDEPLDLPEPPKPGTDLIGLDFLFRINCMNRRLFTTKTGYIGLGPPQIQPGDAIFVLIGSRVPFVLRRHEDQSPVTLRPDDFGGKHVIREITLNKPCYSLIGDCFVHGVMNGEFNRVDTEGQAILLR